MALSGINAAAYDLTSLTAQISESVRHLRAESLQTSAFSSTTSQGTDNQQVSFSMQGFAVSYLEPRAIYSLHQMISEAPEELNREGQERHLSPDKDKDDNQTVRRSNIEENSSLNFISELERSFSASDYAKVTAVYRQSVQINVPEVTLLWGGSLTAEDSSKYAAEAYNTAAGLNQNKEPLINLMHYNNRNFDYKI